MVTRSVGGSGGGTQRKRGTGTGPGTGDRAACGRGAGGRGAGGGRRRGGCWRGGGTGRLCLTLVTAARPGRPRRRGTPAPAAPRRCPSRSGARRCGVPVGRDVARVVVGRDEGVGVGVDVEGADPAAALVGQHLAQAVDVERDHRRSGGRGLQRDDPERLEPGRHATRRADASSANFAGPATQPTNRVRLAMPSSSARARSDCSSGPVPRSPTCPGPARRRAPTRGAGGRGPSARFPAVRRRRCRRPAHALRRTPRQARRCR